MGCGSSSVAVEESARARQGNGQQQATQNGNVPHNAAPSQNQLYPEEREPTPPPKAPTPAPRTPTPAPRTPTPAPRTPTPPPRTPTPRPVSASSVNQEQEPDQEPGQEQKDVNENEEPKEPTAEPEEGGEQQPTEGEDKQEEQEPAENNGEQEQEPTQNNTEQEPIEGQEDKHEEQEPQTEQEQNDDNGEQNQEQTQEPQTEQDPEQEQEQTDADNETQQEEQEQEPQGPQAEDEEPLAAPGKVEPTAKEEKERTIPIPPADGDDEDMDDDADAQMVERDGKREAHMGRQVTFLDCRADPPARSKPERPSGSPSELYVDENFGFEAAMEGLAPEAAWKRPGDFAEKPVLYAEGTTRFDVGQGSAGTCYFLSILSSIADKPEVLNQVIPDDSYKIGSDDYDGVFHCRFWRFGSWEDVYIDDFLPVIYEKTPWGAQSSTDANEMWVPLMEKAFAKFIGSYRQAEGGWAGDAFTALTGGTVERIDMKETSRMQLFDRISNALMAGSVVSCSVPNDKDGEMGLVGGHAYTLTGAAAVPYQGKKTPLIRIRNPWGTDKGEWKGDWSDGAAQWADVNSNSVDKLETRLNVPAAKGDGEFWMSLADFFTFFYSTSICNFVPDFDKDGTPDGLTQLSVTFGEWSGATAAGSDADKKFNNQKFTFTVPDTGEKAIPVVLQFLKYESNDCYIRLDCYKVESEKTMAERECYVLDEITNNMTFLGGSDVSYRYMMEPGQYLALPTTSTEGVEKQFCIRLFAAVDIPVMLQESLPGIFIRRDETKFEHEGETINCGNLTTLWGAWQEGKNAGGQIANRSFPINPQYLLTVEGRESVPMFVSVKQLHEGPRLAMGFKLYPVTEDASVPMDLRALWNNADACLRDIHGDNVFVVAWEASANYVMPAGSYVLLPFTDNPGEEKQYAITLATTEDCNISVKDFNTV